MAEDKRPKPPKAKRPPPFEETHPHLKGFAEFLKELNKETERGAALASAAFIDDLLLRVLSEFMLETSTAESLLQGFNAPLGTFSARIAACHALGLITDAEYRECELIRKVRNEFAHKVKMSFEDKRVAGLCSALEYAAKPYANVTVSTRGAFTSAAVGLILNLTNRPAYVRMEKLTARTWKY